MTSSKALFLFCLFFIIAIALASLIKVPQIIIWGTLILAVIILFISVIVKYHNFSSWKVYSISGFCILFFVLGILRFQIRDFDIKNDSLKKLNDLSEKVTFEGKIIDGSDIRDTFQKLKVKIEGTNSIVLVTSGLYEEYDYLDKIRITGHLKTPMVTDEFNYQNYLLKDGIYSVMDFPMIELISNQPNYNFFSFVYTKILFFKEKLKESIKTNFSLPYRSVLEGIILGNNKTMSQDLKNKFNSAGLTHITAVSGSHIVILSTILMSFLLFLGLWRQQAFYFTIIFVWFYIVLVGFPASGVRAGIMGSLFLLAQKLGRQNTGSRAIIMAAAVMLFQNPLLLFYDVGFQLSFLASLGIIYLHPIINDFLYFQVNFPLKQKLKEIINQKLANLRSIVSVTLSAQIFTLPIIVYNFGNVSLVAPLTNLLILPIIPFLMSFGFLSAFLGVFSHFLGWVFSLPCWVLLIYFLKILDIFFQSWVTVSVSDISLIWFLIYYSILIVFLLFLLKKGKTKFLDY